MLYDVFLSRNKKNDLKLKFILKRFVSLISILRREFVCCYYNLRGSKMERLCVVRGCEINGKLKNFSVGNGSVVENSKITLHSKVEIGLNSVVNSGCILLTASHRTDSESWETITGAIIVGDYCWLATNSIVLPGITIGHGSVVAAGSVVTKDVPDNVIVAGNPAKIVKNRTDRSLEYSPVDLVSMCQAWR